MIDKLIKVQNELKAPKNQYNSFGKYKYRNLEDILESVKPLLYQHGLLLTITDCIENNGMGLYVEATATISDGGKEIFVKAQAGIDPNRKGMDISQTYGSASSYARKYALNGLFLIDDSKDDDSRENLLKNTPTFKAAKDALAKGTCTLSQIENKYRLTEEVKSLLTK